MPNANDDGDYRYEMTQADGAPLTKVIAQRDNGEQLAYADSVDAAFQRGDLDAGEVLAAMREVAPSKVRQIVLAPLGRVERIYDREAQTDAQQAAIRAAVVKAYLPRLGALGYDRRKGESADAVLMRSSLASTLGLEFKVPPVRAALLKQGGATLPPGTDGLPDLRAASPGLLGTALSVAVEENSKPAVDELIAAIPKTTDPVKRNVMLGTLSHAQGATADVARNFALSKNVKVGEMGMVLRGGRDTVAQRNGLWNWFTAHYDQVVARTGVFSGGFLPFLAAGGGCSSAEAQRVEACFKRSSAKCRACSVASRRPMNPSRCAAP